MLLDYYKDFQKYFIHSDIENYGKKDTQFVGGDNLPKRIVDFKQLEKGCELWIEGGKYPMRTHASEIRVAVVAQAKRLIPLLTSSTKRKLFFILNIDCIIDWLHYYLSDVYLESNLYSQPVREVYRVIKNKKVRDIICAILEYDLAYRFRFQDVIVNFDKDSDIIKEIERMLDLLIQRDEKNMKEKWKKLRSLVWLLRFNRKLLKEIKYFIKEINLEEIKSSVEDIYWQADYQDYCFEGLSYNQRQLKRELL